MRRLMKLMMIVALIITIFSLEVSALSESVPNSRYQEIDIFKNGFDISNNGLATCKVSLESQSSDRTVKVYAYIQRYENGIWTTIKSGNASEDDGDVSIFMQLIVASGYDYRLKSYAYVYQDGVWLESDTYLSAAKYY